jgi:hypothetical protein
MGNVAGFKSCSNICTCQQKNIVIPSEFVVNVNETNESKITYLKLKGDYYKILLYILN